MGITNPLTAYNFDTRVGIFGLNVDGYLAETKTVGTGKNRKSVPRYSNKQAIRKATRDMGGGGKRSNRVALDLAMMAQGVDVIDS